MKKEIFVTAGCSFTWGQGLYYYDWIKNTELDQNEIKSFLNRYKIPVLHNNWENLRPKLTVGDWNSIRSLRYSDLISNKLDMDYITYSGNNNDNFQHIYDILTTDKYILMEDDKLLNRKLKFVVFQLTAAGRDSDTGGNYTVKHIKNTVDNMDELYNFLKERDIKLLVWCMTEDLGYSLKDKPYFLKIKFDGIEYNSFNDLAKSDNHLAGIKGNPQFELSGDLKHYGVTDEHPSKRFHKLISDTILNKLEN